MKALNDVLSCIQNRQSCGLLTDPAPNINELHSVYQCALTAPDHGRIKPWRYLIVSGKARQALGELFVDATKKSGKELTQGELIKYQNMPMRAPLIIVAIASIKDHPKVPASEQLMSAGVGVGQMLIALQSLGYGGYWRTGPLAYNSHVKKELGLMEKEEIVGFLYVGTPQKELKSKQSLSVEQYFKQWP